jgi:uncharacterized LabA/DUF88 family protein
MGLRTAILIDGSYFLKRYRYVYPPPHDDPRTVARTMYNMVRAHAQDKYLHRIFYYDCHPFSKKVDKPLRDTPYDFAESDMYKFRIAFFNELKRMRKVALRLGNIRDGHKWILRPDKNQELIDGRLKSEDLRSEHFTYDLRQKGVDIKIGCDIAALAFKQLVHQIILISGDSDFVPAAKVARREGIDFVLDPMWNPISPELFEHIDGLNSTCPNPHKR